MAVAVTNAKATALMAFETETTNTSVVVVPRQPPVSVPTDLTPMYAAVGGVVGGIAVTAALMGGCWLWRERNLRDRGVVEDTQDTEELP